MAPELPLIDGDHHQLCQVFTNLLTNAFEALDGRGRIAITATADAVEQDPAFAQRTAGADAAWSSWKWRTTARASRRS